MMKKVAIGALSLVIAMVVGGMVHAAPLVVDDFDSGSKPNRLGGDFGSWDKDPNDQTQGCQIAFDSTVKHGDLGYAIKIDYDVESPNPAYNGFWMKLNNLDASKYTSLTFYTKGDSEKGFTSQVKIELKNRNEVGKYMVTGLTDQWQKIAIPLSKFRGLNDATALTEFVVVFDDINSTEKYGAIYIDDIAFE
jgi:hypothetical protein